MKSLYVNIKSELKKILIYAYYETFKSYYVFDLQIYIIVIQQRIIHGFLTVYFKFTQFILSIL